MRQNISGQVGELAPPHFARLTIFRVFAPVIFILALLLRTSGLSHDLHLNRVYHPDTPKQMRAVERFLDGNYYQIMGGRDYDGYPYFNSHLVEYLVRGYQAAGGAFVRHLGIADQVERPSYLALYWITRALNALLSALAVLMVMALGRRYISSSTGLTAGLLLALSPVDVTACHFASADTTAAFFALAVTAIAARIMHSPVIMNYIAAGLLSAAAFSTKYHGGMALIAVLVAHMLSAQSLKTLFTRPSIGRISLLALSFIIGVFITSPGLLIAPKTAIKQILAFLEYTASFGMTAEMMSMSLPERIRMGISLNIPALADATGIIPLGLALLGLWAGRKKTFIWVTATVPVVYILAGLSTKPLTHPVYHTMATPGIMLTAATAWHALFAAPRLRLAGRTTALVLLIAAAAHLLYYCRTELFFFRHNDTRYLSHIWAQDNIPPSFSLHASKYTFNPEAWATNRLDKKASAFVYSGRDPVRPPAGSEPLYTLALEEDKLTAFRNWPQQFFVRAPGIMEQPFTRPGFMPMPAFHPQNMIMAGAPWLIRHPATWLLDAGQRKSGALASPNRLERAFWLVRAGVDPCDVTLTLAGQHARIRLGAGETSIIEVEQPRPASIRKASNHFYRWHLNVHFGNSRISLLTNPRDIGWAYFNAGDYEKARQSFASIPDGEQAPGDEVALALSKLITQAGNDQNYEPSQNIFPARASGIHPDVLRELPSLTFTQERWPTNLISGYRHREDLSDKVIIPGMPLEPGIYTINLSLEQTTPSLNLEITDIHGRVLERTQLTPATGNGTDWSGSFTVDHIDGFAEFRVLFPPSHSPVVLSATIRPDHEATLDAYYRLLRTWTESATFTPSRLWYKPLVDFGNTLARTGKTELARIAYANAANASPMRQNAQDRLNPDSTSSPVHIRHPVHAHFKNDAELRHFQISRKEVRSGESLEIATHWNSLRLNRATYRHSIYIQGIPAGDKKARFFGNAFFIEGLRMNEKDDFITPASINITVPPDTPPGTYEILAGLWIPSQERRIHVRSADLPFDRRGVVLTTIEVLP